MLKIAVELASGDVGGVSKSMLSKVCFSTTVHLHC